jgi:glutathione synthase/RimK-type ligase-like ATP-grasp enzyme
LEDIEDTYPVAMIPERGESIRTGWRHNLAHGATARLIDPASPEARPIVDIARRAAHALGVAFSAVDVADIASDLKVLEVNTGIVTNHLLHQVPLAAPIVRDLYATVVEHLFALAEKPESRGTDGGGGAAGIAEPACRSRVM